jgi:hypothetical protein
MIYRNCVIERVWHNGYWVTRHATEGRLMADTLAGLKMLIRHADQRGA